MINRTRNKTNKMWGYFHCQQCGACCLKLGLPYDPLAIHEMASFLKLSVREVIEKFYGEFTSDGKYWESNDNKRTPCPFLKASGSKKYCSIYAVRPIGCQLYPIETDGGRDGIDCPAWEIAYSRLKSGQEKEE